MIERPPSVPAPKDSSGGVAGSYSAENRPLPKRAIVFSDTDNDVACVKNTLRVVGIVNKKGEIDESVDGLEIIHTGDLVDKKNPDPAVIEFWESLRHHAGLIGWQVKIIAGNHELEAWQRITRGETFRLPKIQLARLCGFIEGLDLIHVDDTVLFLHGYPTLGFLRTLLHFREVTGKDLNRFNEDHFRKAFKSSEAISQYAYVKGKAGENYILCDVAEASGYYKKHGRNVATILKELDIHTVVHGHRPQRSGMQTDYEFARWIPGVRMISNDTKVKARGLGATVIRVKQREEPEVVFINTLVDYKKTRKQVRGLLRMGVVVPLAPSEEPPDSPEPAEADPEKIVVVPRLPPVEPPGSPQPRQLLVDETAPLLPDDRSKGEHPRPGRRESKSRYRHRTKWRLSIGAAALTVSLAGPGLYWLKREFQRDPAEIQQAHDLGKVHADRLATEMPWLREKLEETHEQSE